MKNIPVLKNTPETLIQSEELFSQYPYLRNFEKEIGTLKDGDVLGEGTQGLILRSRLDQVVVKLPLHEEGAGTLKAELETHSDFYKALKSARINGLVPDTVRIPASKAITGSEGIYAMELVDGLTLKSLQIRSHFKDFLKNEDPKFLDSLNDRQLESLLEKKYKVSKPEIDSLIDSGVDVLRRYLPSRADDLQTTLDYLRTE